MAALTALKSTNFDLGMVFPLLLIVMNFAAQELNRLHRASYRPCPNPLDGKICRSRQET
jgi:hypothetical protein